MSPRIAIVIPARLNSQRLPKKILADIGGRPLVWWTWQRALRVPGVDRVIIAVDDKRVRGCLRAFGADPWLTPRGCASGTERAAFVARHLNADVIVNIQADEPFFSVRGVSRLIHLFRRNPAADVATIACPIRSARDLADPNVVKVVLAHNNAALYFSRYPVPYVRESACRAGLIRQGRFLKHIGIYAYRKRFLSAVSSLVQPWIEASEKLEQLGFLYGGYAIQVVRGNYDSLGIDTREDLSKARRMITCGKS